MVALRFESCPFEVKFLLICNGLGLGIAMNICCGEDLPGIRKEQICRSCPQVLNFRLTTLGQGGPSNFSRSKDCFGTPWKKDLVHTDTTFRIFKISKFYTFISLKIIALKYIGRYLHDKYMPKFLLKIHCILGNIKKKNF
jgi:hypothetical protein